MKKVFVLLCFAALLSSRASAELKYTVKTEAQKTEAPKTEAPKTEAPGSKAPNPMLAMMGDALSRQLLPEGSATMTYLIGEKGTRIDFVNAAMGQAAGTVIIVHPDGTTLMLNPKDQTYWKASMPAAGSAMQAAGLTPQVTSSRTGEVETVAGVKCERSTFTMKMDLPIPPAARASLGADFPSSLDLAGDTCLTTDQFQNYAQMAAKTQATGMLAAMGIDKLPQGGIALRQTVRVGGVELRSAVTEIAEAPGPEGAFEIPAGYKEVPPPTAAPR